MTEQDIVDDASLRHQEPEPSPARQWLELSLAQHAVWVDARMNGPVSYQLGNWARISTTMDQTMDPDAFRQSVSLLMARHDALRLRVDDGLPRQWMDSSVVPPISLLKFPEDADPDLAFQRHIEEAFARPMPLGDHPLFHVDLIRASDSLYFMLWRFHHLIADSLSVWLTLRLWTGAYLALTSDTPTLLEPPSSYLPVIAADAAYRASAACKRDGAYWTSRFEPLPPALLPVHAGGSPGLVSVVSELSAAEVGQLSHVALRAGVSQQRVLFALYALALSLRLTQPDVVTGIALHRRDHGNRNTIGMFSGVLAVRCGFDPAATLLDCVLHFSSLMERDLRHQRLPVDEIARALGLFRVGRARLYEATVSYLAAEHFRGDEALDGAPVTSGVVTLSEASPLSLHLSELSATGALAIRLTANTLHVNGAEANAVHAIFHAAIGSFLEDPEVPVESIAATHTGAGAGIALPAEEWEL
jgi:hypothetical protein